MAGQCRQSPSTIADLSGMIWIFWSIIGCSLLLPLSTVSAQALRFQPQGASAAGQGNAFAAQADDASAIQYNPAGLTQVEGVQIYTGTVLVGGSIKYKSPLGVDTRGDLGGS